MDSWVTKVTPGLDVSGKTERLDAAAGGNLTWWWYNADANLNTVDYDVRGRAAYRFSDTFRASATGAYRKESNPDRIFEDTGLVQNFQVDYRQDYTASAEYALSEKAAATLSYAYQQVEYPDRPFQDFTSHTADLGFSYNLSRFATETKGRLDLGFGRGGVRGAHGQQLHRDGRGVPRRPRALERPGGYRRAIHDLDVRRAGATEGEQ